MSGPSVALYGSWKSPITADLIVAGTIGLGQLALDGEEVYWVESRPAESGRNVLVRRSADGERRDLTPAPFDVRTRVHEYGGGAYAVQGGTVVFSNFSDQRLYRIGPGGEPRAVTPEAALRYADGMFVPGKERLICVREDHRGGGEPVNALVALDLDGGAEGGLVLADGHDFYANPRLSPDGSRLAWLCWDHPNMPWDGTELWVGQLVADGEIGQAERVAGGLSESIFQPHWSPDGVLHFVSDRTGWWNLYLWRDGKIEALCEREAEFGLPQWVFGQSTYGFADATTIIGAYTERGVWRLASLSTESGRLESIQTPYTQISDLRVANGRAVFVAASPNKSAAVVRLDLGTGGLEVLRRSSELAVDSVFLSVPEAIEFPTEGGLTAHAIFYPPKNGDFVGTDDELPPLIVISHGGPTGATSAALNLTIQFWTSRGFALVDVDYGGSTGHGRAYRERLDGRWGIVDVDDCVNAAHWLCERRLVDPKRLAIRGGSAGGYTTLAALTFRDLFTAGASYYGISDLEALAKETHKFESRYLDRLVGPYPARRDIYLERSPIHFAERLSSPLVLFQGLEDKVVPPSQAELMFEAVKAKGLPVAYVPFEGEQHGFRKAETIKRALEAELYFYSKVFSFEPADRLDGVRIENL